MTIVIRILKIVIANSQRKNCSEITFCIFDIRKVRNKKLLENTS